MTSATGSEAEWKSWHEVQKQAVRLAMTGNFLEAISLLNDFALRVHDRAVRASALSFRGDLHRDAGKPEAAKADYAAVLSLGTANSYERYTLEVAIAAVTQSLGQAEEAAEWYRSALTTALNETDQTGATAIRGLTSMNRQLDPKAEDLCKRVARKGWAAAGLPGEPDLSRLSETAEKIIRAPAGPRG